MVWDWIVSGEVVGDHVCVWKWFGANGTLIDDFVGLVNLDAMSSQTSVFAGKISVIRTFVALVIILSQTQDSHRFLRIGYFFWYLWKCRDCWQSWHFVVRTGSD